MPASPFPTRLFSTHSCAMGLSVGLGLIVPLAFAGAARAQERGWVDPPARPAAAASASPKAAAPAPDDEALPKAASTPAANPNRAVALERPSSGARMRRPGQLADTPAGAGPQTRFASAEPPSGDRAAAARDLAKRYLAAVSGPGEAMVGAAPRFYGARVRFYGRPATLAAVIAEKRSFVRRWPERSYAPRTIRTACDGDSCTVRAVVDFRAASPQRGAVSRGAAELVLEVRFSGARPVIVAETGRVLRRGAQAGTLAPTGGRA